MTDARDAAGIVVETDVMVRMRDGVHLACDVYRPASGGPVPALVQRQPYDKRVAQTYVYDHPAVYARHGYAVVIEDTRGRHASEGEFYPSASMPRTATTPSNGARHSPGATAGWGASASPSPA